MPKTEGGLRWGGLELEQETGIEAEITANMAVAGSRTTKGRQKIETNNIKCRQ